MSSEIIETDFRFPFLNMSRFKIRIEEADFKLFGGGGGYMVVGGGNQL